MYALVRAGPCLRKEPGTPSRTATGVAGAPVPQTSSVASQSAHQQEAQSEAEAEPYPRPSDMECGYPKWQPTVPQHPPLTDFLTVKILTK